ncbi:hypothetical protein AMAG_13421 [Allomyces macrogynus ATCC 38327]|uniref:Uncharacterized protein n=1 Tax=Allomyces macrogynus (strain ATCC 38327) TaxID=578462 RepID=A0A0L0T294_ALLM3|nr:hypothetical protein AMAG_13421 [Allomyces macrogynus ATCC 38327]|eukprot:KNE68780.1 hypothetical protein AMAG_13421 [Allomyces macrogynus ATCC 38327]
MSSRDHRPLRSGGIGPSELAALHGNVTSSARATRISPVFKPERHLAAQHQGPPNADQASLQLSDIPVLFSSPAPALPSQLAPHRPVPFFYSFETVTMDEGHHGSRGRGRGRGRGGFRGGRGRGGSYGGGRGGGHGDDSHDNHRGGFRGGRGGRGRGGGGGYQQRHDGGGEGGHQNRHHDGGSFRGGRGGGGRGGHHQNRHHQHNNNNAIPGPRADPNAASGPTEFKEYMKRSHNNPLHIYRGHYEHYPVIPVEEWLTRYLLMNQTTDNLRSDRIPLVIPELRVADGEWGDVRLDGPEVGKVPVVGWLPIQLQRNGLPWDQAGPIAANPAISLPSIDAIDVTKSWPHLIDPLVRANRRLPGGGMAAAPGMFPAVTAPMPGTDAPAAAAPPMDLNPLQPMLMPGLVTCPERLPTRSNPNPDMTPNPLKRPSNAHQYPELRAERAQERANTYSIGIALNEDAMHAAKKMRTEAAAPPAAAAASAPAALFDRVAASVAAPPRAAW